MLRAIRFTSKLIAGQGQHTYDNPKGENLINPFLNLSKQHSYDENSRKETDATYPQRRRRFARRSRRIDRLLAASAQEIANTESRTEIRIIRANA